MTKSTSPITADESMWGKLSGYTSSEDIALINKSPLLVAELNQYQEGVDNGTVQPMAFDNNGAKSLETTNDGIVTLAVR